MHQYLCHESEYFQFHWLNHFKRLPQILTLLCCLSLISKITRSFFFLLIIWLCGSLIQFLILIFCFSPTWILVFIYLSVFKLMQVSFTAILRSFNVLSSIFNSILNDKKFELTCRKKVFLPQIQASNIKWKKWKTRW